MIDDRSTSIPDPCIVPSSELGRLHGAGKVVARWSNMVAVDFAGHLAHLTIDRHTFLAVEGK